MCRCWYVYLGGSGTQPQINGANYRVLPCGQLSDCSGVNEICAIYAPSCGINPDYPLSQNMQSYIIAALASNYITRYPAWPQRAYVYKKD